MTFTAFHDVLKAQSDAIKTLERALESKATKSELAAVSQSKASAADVEMQLQQLKMQLKLKADRSAGSQHLQACLRSHSHTATCCGADASHARANSCCSHMLPSWQPLPTASCLEPHSRLTAPGPAPAAGLRQPAGRTPQRCSSR